MNGKSTLWIILFVLAAGAAGTGFYLNYQNSREAEQQKLAFEEATDNLATSRTHIQELEKEVENLKSSIADQQAPDLTAELEAKEAEIATLTEQLSGKETEIKNLADQVTAMQQQQDTIASLTQQLDEKDAALQDILAQQEQVQQQQDALALELQTKTEEITALSVQLEKAADLQNTIDTLRQDRDQLAEELMAQKAEAAARAISPEMSVDEQVLELSQKIASLEASQKEKETIIARQDTRIQELTEHVKAGQQDLTDKILALTSAIQSSQSQSSDAKQTELEQKLQDLTQKLEKMNQGLGMEEELTELRAQLSERDVQGARLTSQIEALTEERSQLKAQLEKQEQQLAQKESVMQDLTVRLEQLTKEVLPSDALDQKKIAELTRQIAELTQQIAEITKQITTQESQKERLQEQITQITKQLETAIQEKDGLLLDLMKQRESEKEATEAEKERLQQQIQALETNINQKDEEISGFKALIAEKETALTELQTTYDADVAVREDKITSLQKALKEMDEKYQELTKQYTLQESSLTASQAEKQTLEEQVAQALQQLETAQTKITALEKDIAARETEYQQKIEAHNQMITQLKDDIESGNMEKATIQSRLQEELDRSEAEYQERLQQLALQKEKEIEALQTEAETYEKMTETLKEQIEAKDIEIKQVKERLTVKIVDKIVFSSGSATINAKGHEVLDTVGEFLKQNLEDRQIQVEGHTDAVPIGMGFQDKYPTNWELSTARAVNVVRYLQEGADIPASKLSAVGYGEFRPIADNDSPEGRALNRRIELLLIPELPVSE